MSIKLENELSELQKDRVDIANSPDLSNTEKEQILANIDIDIEKIKDKISKIQKKEAQKAEPKPALKAKTEKTPAPKKTTEKAAPVKEVPKVEEKPAPKEEPKEEKSAQKEEKPPRTLKEVPAGKDPLEHCKDVLTAFRTKQKATKIKNELIAAAKGDEKKVAEIEKMSQESLLEAAPEKPTLSVPAATKEKLLSVITFNVRQKVAKQKISKESMDKINEKIPEIVDAFYRDLDSIISNTIKNLK